MSIEASPDPKRLDWKQACALLGCSRAKFYRMVHAGEITAYRLGKRGLWVRQEECENILKKMQLFVS